MKTLYFDCFAGASGDMILGALVGAGVEPLALIEQLELLGVSGWQIDFEKVDRSGISATYAKVKTAPEHAHRHLSEILKIIDDSRLSDRVKDRAARIFSRLAEAEAQVHNELIEKIHFHEVGALDAIIDVCGAAIGFELLGIEKFIASPLRVGTGMIEMAHGNLCRRYRRRIRDTDRRGDCQHSLRGIRANAVDEDRRKRLWRRRSRSSEVSKCAPCVCGSN